MSDLSARLSLPFLLPAQAQKHVTHNEALLLLDALVQTGIAGFDAITPPPNAAPGALYALGASPTGDWAGQGGKLALRQNDGWLYLQPLPGWRAWDLTVGQLMVFDNGTWSDLTPELNNLDGLGIGTGWDATNRLSVASEASLFSHAGAGHQVKVNKAQVGDTASVLFQSGFTGHAEMGLAGDTAFALKLSADGTTWIEALKADAGAGTITAALPITGPAVQQNPADTTPGRLMRADWGYGPGSLLGAVSQSGGQPTGAVIERGANANGRYTRFADGTQICTRNNFGIAASSSVICNALWTYPASFTDVPDFLDLTLSLTSGDWSDTTLRDNVSTVGTLGAPSVNSANLGFYSNTGSITVTVQNCRCLAIGRWF